MPNSPTTISSERSASRPRPAHRARRRGLADDAPGGWRGRRARRSSARGPRRSPPPHPACASLRRKQRRQRRRRSSGNASRHQRQRRRRSRRSDRLRRVVPPRRMVSRSGGLQEIEPAQRPSGSRDRRPAAACRRRPSAATLASSNRSLAYSSTPSMPAGGRPPRAARSAPPTGRTSRLRRRPAAGRRRRARQAPARRAAADPASNASITWNSGCRDSDRAGLSTSTSRSNGRSGMAIGRKVAAPHPADQLLEPRVARRVGAQHQRVDEEPDQIVQRSIAAPRDRAADRDVAARTKPRQQPRKPRLQHHEQARARARRASAASPRCSSGIDRQTAHCPPRWLATGGRGRSTGSSICSGSPASAVVPVRKLPRQHARRRRPRRPAPPAATACSRRTAPAAAASAADAPAHRARYNAARSRDSGPSDQPSPAM